ncbi:DUF6153 family protein [Streptomyces sp. NBC_01275]|nr:DUF6153 family protein [Streptomyces sp. NBC_01275]
MWRRAVCVLGLLVGLLAMHGLAPGGLHTAHADTPTTAVARTAEVARTTAVAAEAHDGCSGEGHCGGGHAQHADTTCASAALGAGPALPGLVADPVPVPVPDAVVSSQAAAGPDGARAPPSLAELQLLRI